MNLIKKSFVFLMLTLMLVSYVTASDIAYLVKSPTKLNSNLINGINELGYSYDVINDSAIPSTNFANYKMILMGDETFANYKSIPVSSKKSLIINSYYADDFKIAKSISSTVSNSYAYGTIALNNSITNGVTNPVQFFTIKNVPIYYPGYPRAPGFVSVVNSGNPGDSVVGYIEKGGVLYGGEIAGERLVFIGNTNANSWSDGSKQLFKNSIQWILRDLCTDVDGDYAIKENTDVSVCENVCGPNHDETCIRNNDCNDSKVDGWQFLNGYVDSDEDGLGFGSQLEVCSGESLPAKYSDTPGDCNDNNSGLWELLPGYLDSDLDGLGTGNLLQVCSGVELPQGYSTNNLDCNDSDSNTYQLLQGYVDNDQDGLGIGNLLQVCSGESLPAKYSDIPGDCNDSNGDLWQLLPAYLDSDLDGFGTGNLLDVCSGVELPQGYSEINGDCNDSDSNTYQLLQGYVDNDQDGFGIGDLIDVCSGESLPPKYSTINGDCNDSDSNTYQLLQGYVDNDQDGFGIGDLIDVCSGVELPQGYSTTVGDCNDNNSQENPDLSEIPYNSLDDSCQGYDLADVDSDGYCKSGYVIIDSSLQCPNEEGLVGTDCNDENSTINPGSNDLSNNCINNGPHLNSIGKRIVYEGDNVVIIPHGTDPENDILTYSINDSRFIEDNNVFSWKTEEGERGTYYFKLNVSDGELSDSIVFEVEVRKTNEAPVCNQIPGIEWNEGQNISIDLKQYCSDIENDIIYYIYENSSQGDLISLDSLENGVVSFSSPEGWYGNGWIIFKVSDGKNSTLTNEIELRVNKVNKIPTFTGNISDLSWEQDSNLTNVINLNSYFSDRDNNLTFSFNENEFIGIVIENGIVSFYPTPDWFGSEKIIFNATDGEYNVSSNEINLNVLRVNKAPSFESNDCNIALLEDNSYNCKLNASDPENDVLSYSVITRTNLNCNINGDNLTYVGFKDYFGPASCLLKVTDSHGKYDEILFEVNIENVNDNIYVTDYYPKIDPRLLTGSNQIFQVNMTDLDSPIRINWSVNGQIVGYGTNYLFNGVTNGVYNVTATGTDGEYSTFVSWDVFVGSLNQFRCSEVSGNVCSATQMCSQNFILTSDSSRCCPVQCSQIPPQFEGIKNITQNRSENIKLRLINPYDSQLVRVGDTLNIRLEVQNNQNVRENFNSEIYLYDLTKEKVIEKEKKSLTISEFASKVAEVSFNIGEDINEADDYAIVARVIGKENQTYNQNYTKIRIERKDNYVVIKNLTLNPQDGAICGDSVYANVDVENLGRTDESVIIKIESSALSLDQSYSTLLEKYDESYKINKEFKINIPAGAKAGNYTIISKIIFASGRVETLEKILTIGECRTESTEISEVETIRIESQTKSAESIIPNNRMLIFIIMSVLTLTLFVFVIIILVIYNRKNMHANSTGTGTKSIEGLQLLDSKNIMDNKVKTSKKVKARK